MELLSRFGTGDLILTKDALYQLSYSSATAGCIIAYYAQLCKG